MFCSNCSSMADGDPDSKQKKGEKFLRKAEREVCYKARDGFWDCMKVGAGLLDRELINF